MFITSPLLTHRPNALFVPIIAATMLTVPVAEAKRCAVEDSSGYSSLVVNAGRISAADVQNRSAAAWTKIAEAAQQKYGGDVNVGMVAMTVKVDVQPLGVGPSITTTVPMTIVFDYDGQQSINQSVQDFAGIPRGAKDPSACEPEKNACCTECGWANDYASASQFFKAGFFSHDEFIAARLSHGSRKVMKKFSLVREDELA